MSTNEHTGARLVSKVPSKEYQENYDKIFGKKEESSVSPCQGHAVETDKEEEKPKCRKCTHWTLGCCGSS